MELTKETCLKMKEERRKQLRKLSIDEKIRIVEELRNRIEPIRDLRRKRSHKQMDERNTDCVNELKCLKFEMPKMS